MDIGHGDVLVLMGSQSDANIAWYACKTLGELNITHTALIASAHRTPDRIEVIADQAYGRGYRAIIAVAGLAAALPGDLSARCWTVPILGVAVPNPSDLAEQAAMLSMTHLPSGTPVAFCGIGAAGAVNAALIAAAIVTAIKDGADATFEHLQDWRYSKSASVAEKPDFTAMEKK